mmetsp:Transcript_29426/g.52894  ORF Transcript_29426/g.52894 Transcript_29426/m.52894 type:complete len:203 (-) Transcript_29426:352-960(-)
MRTPSALLPSVVGGCESGPSRRRGCGLRPRRGQTWELGLRCGLGLRLDSGSGLGLDLELDPWSEGRRRGLPKGQAGRNPQLPPGSEVPEPQGQGCMGCRTARRTAPSWGSTGRRWGTRSCLEGCSGRCRTRTGGGPPPGHTAGKHASLSPGGGLRPGGGRHCACTPSAAPDRTGHRLCHVCQSLEDREDRACVSGEPRRGGP